MSRVSSRRILFDLVLYVLAAFLLAAGAIAFLARTVPSFNRYILLVPVLKPFRYYPPDPPPPPEKRVPPMPERLRFAKRGVRSVEVSAVADSSIAFEQGRIARKHDDDLPLLAASTFSGPAAEELVALWDAQLLDCADKAACCFSPSYRLRFFNTDGSVFVATLCWSFERIQMENESCRWDSKTPQAGQLKRKLRSLLPPLSTAVDWAISPYLDRDPATPLPPTPVSFGPVSASSPQEVALLRRELWKREGYLAYCYEKLPTQRLKMTGQLVVEFDLAPYSPEEHAARRTRRPVVLDELSRPPYFIPLMDGRSTLHLKTGKRSIEHLTLVRSTVPDPALTECVLDRMRHWSLRRHPSRDRAPLHVSVTIEFRSPLAGHDGE